MPSGAAKVDADKTGPKATSRLAGKGGRTADVTAAESTDGSFSYAIRPVMQATHNEDAHGERAPLRAEDLHARS